MPAEVFELKNYTYYQFSGRDGSPGVFKAVAICFSGDGKTAYLYFDGTTTPLPEAHKNGNSYFLYYRYADMGNIIDMLRNEKPVYLIYMPDGPNSRVSTSSEPVGEGEV
jgi:hypothetical protein